MFQQTEHPCRLCMLYVDRSRPSTKKIPPASNIPLFPGIMMLTILGKCAPSLHHMHVEKNLHFSLTDVPWLPGSYGKLNLSSWLGSSRETVQEQALACFPPFWHTHMQSLWMYKWIHATCILNYHLGKFQQFCNHRLECTCKFWVKKHLGNV